MANSFPFHFEIDVHDRFQTEMRWKLLESDRLGILDCLNKLEIGARREVNFSLQDTSKNETWMLFFKLRTPETRLMLAHPGEKEWVATLAFEPSHLKSWLEAFQNLTPGKEVAIAELGCVWNLSNFHLVVSLAE